MKQQNRYPQPKVKLPIVKPEEKQPILPADTSIASPLQNTTEAHFSPQKSSNSSARIIALILLMLLTIGLFFYFRNRENRNSAVVDPGVAIEHRSPEQVKLQDTLDKLQGNILILSDSMFKMPILINEPIRINRDSLYIKAESKVTLQSDSSYQGEPFVIAPANKSILLENVEFMNFRNVNSLQQKGVLLKNVKILNADSAAVSTKP